jgi:predicted nuclease with RNAse H fold
MRQKQSLIAGIDFGSKTAGTTVICVGSNINNLQFLLAPKKTNADDFIIEHITLLKPDVCFIDAPLSLPAALIQNTGNGDYLYRLCDKQTNALSPLFLGTYAARAIQLKKWLQNTVELIETYPSELLKELNLASYYNKKDKQPSETLINALNQITGAHFTVAHFPTMHHFDALLCWLSARRFKQNKHKTYGNAQEGLILV